MASKEIKNNLKRNQILMIMKKLLLLFPLLLSCLWGIAADEFRVAELRCEYRDNPLAINTLTPQFSWQTLSVGRGFLQAGYQIQVASDPADLARGRKLLWDEQRKSDVSLHVRYAGRTLKPGQRYYWRVRVSDAAGNYSPWSEIRSFAVGLLDGRPYEIFTGLQDDDEGIIIPKSVNTGRIIKNVDENGNKRYDFQFENKRGYKMTIEGLSEKFNKEYWNYAKLISGVLRWRMPIEQVIKLVGSLQLDSENINTWKNGVERALKKYVQDGTEAKGKKCPNCGNETLVYQEGCLICTTCGASRCG